MAASALRYDAINKVWSASSLQLEVIAFEAKHLLTHYLVKTTVFMDNYILVYTVALEWKRPRYLPTAYITYFSPFIFWGHSNPPLNQLLGWLDRVVSMRPVVPVPVAVAAAALVAAQPPRQSPWPASRILRRVQRPWPIDPWGGALSSG